MLTSAEKQYLRTIGLSSQAIKLYDLLLECGDLDAQQAAQQLNEFPSAQYRLFFKLEALGLVRRIAGRPRRYASISKEIGLAVAYRAHQRQLELLLNPSPDKVTASAQLIIGRQALYKQYVTLAEQAKREIWIYAIGIAYSTELHKTQVAAIQRGISIHHIVQQIKPSNYHVVDRWQRVGVKLRYASNERGFHAMIFDSTRVIVSFSDPQNTDDRLSILTDNQTAIKLFRDYFKDMWATAQPVKL